MKKIFLKVFYHLKLCVTVPIGAKIEKIQNPETTGLLTSESFLILDILYLNCVSATQTVLRVQTTMSHVDVCSQLFCSLPISSSFSKLLKLDEGRLIYVSSAAKMATNCCRQVVQQERDRESF